LNLRSVGQTAVQVTPLGFGGAPLGNLYAAVTDVAAKRTVDAAWSSGCRYFDTAPSYGYGLSERRLGDRLRHRPRADYVLSTKVGRLLHRGRPAATVADMFASPMPFHAVFDYSYDGVMRSIEHSYQRLGLERIDIAFIHDIGRVTHGERHSEVMKGAMEGAYRALDTLRREGQIGAIGIGVNEFEVCAEALRHGDFDCFLLAGRYTLLEQTALDDFFPRCAAKGISVIIGGPFNSGILARGDVPDATYNYEAAPADVRARVGKLADVCARHRVSMPAAALQFVLAHPVVASVIPGARDAVEVKGHWKMLRHTIPPEFWSELREVGLLHPMAPVPTGAF
jgi:D-threo-aldose 1-dehydrogenase